MNATAACVFLSSRKSPVRIRKGSIEKRDVKRRARRPILSIKKYATGENTALLAANLDGRVL